MKKHLLLLSAGLGISLSATGHAALIHLDSKEYVLDYSKTDRIYVGGSLTVEPGDIFAAPLVLECLIDSSGRARPIPDYANPVGGGLSHNGQSEFEEGHYTFNRSALTTALGFGWSEPLTSVTTKTFLIIPGVQRDTSLMVYPQDYGWVQGSQIITVTFHPVPEPASMAVLGLGALALLRRKKRA